MSKLFSLVRLFLPVVSFVVLAPILLIEQAYACACCNTYHVVNVASGDQLNVREGPHYNARWVGAIQPGDCGIMRLGPEAYDPNGTLWYQITYSGITGWVHSQYIEWIPSSGRQSPPNQTQHQYPPPPNQTQHQYPPHPNQYSGSGGARQPYWCNQQGNHNSAEAAVCDTPSLWSLDNTLRTAYDRARSDSPVHSGGIRDSQKGWLLFRNQCGHDVNCLNGRYRERIRWLGTFFSN